MARVVASKADSVPVGAIVSSNGWQRFTVQPASSATMFEDGTSADGLDPAHHIGVLGGNGLTAYFGFYEIGKPKAGETVLVSGAAGSVGHLVCQCAPPLCSRTCCTAVGNHVVVVLQAGEGHGLPCGRDRWVGRQV